MMVWVASGGEALPLFHRDTVGRDTLTMFATSEPLSPPRCSRSSKIRATALSITTGTPTCCIHVSQEVFNETELYLQSSPVFGSHEITADLRFTAQSRRTPSQT